MKSKVEPNEEQKDCWSVNVLSITLIHHQALNLNERYRGKKNYMLVFKGDNSKNWIYQVKLYFSIFSMSEDDKL